MAVRDDILASGAFELVSIITDAVHSQVTLSLIPAPEGGQSLEFVLLDALEPVSWPFPPWFVSPGAIDSFPWPGHGRWTIQMQLSASGPQVVSNCAEVFTIHAPDGYGAPSTFVPTPDPNSANNRACVNLDIAGTADLAIDKSWSMLDTETPVAGATVVYTLSVANLGPSAANNVVVEDILPAGLAAGTVTIVQAFPGAECTVGVPGDPAQPLRCNIGNIQGVGAAGADGLEVVLTAQIDPAYFAENADPVLLSSPWLNNSARVASDTFDPDMSNNMATVSIAIGESTTFEVDVWGEPESVVAGEVMQYPIVLLNHGPSVVRDFDIDVNTGLLPGRITGYQIMTGDAQCNIGAMTSTALDCIGERLGVGSDNAVEIVATVLIDPGAMPDADPPEGYEVMVSAYDDTGTTIVTDTTRTYVATFADLEVTKTASTNTPVAGETMTFEIVVSNAGPSTARSVVLTDVLPAGMSSLIDTLGCGAALEGCWLGDIDAGQQKSVQVTVQVDDEVPCGSTLDNTVLVSSGTQDPDGIDPSTTASVSVACLSDLRVLKFGKPDGAVRAGEMLTYTVLVDNLGPSAAEGANVKDLFAASMPFSVISMTSNIAYGEDMTCNVDPATLPVYVNSAPYQLQIECTLAEELPPLQPDAGRWTLDFTVVAQAGGSINNVVAVSSTSSDPDLTNNQATTAHDVTAVADLEITKRVSDSLVAGMPATYVIDVNNLGPSAAENVVVIDSLPPGFQPTGYSILDGEGLPWPGACQLGGGSSSTDQMTCALGALSGEFKAAGASGQVEITVVGDLDPNIADGTSLNNDVMVVADTLDANNGNNFASVAAPVSNAVTLQASKQAIDPFVYAGNAVSFMIYVENDGPSTARHVQIDDMLPPGFAILKLVPAYGEMTCAYGGSSIVLAHCTQDALEPGEHMAVVIEAGVPAYWDQDTYTNTAYIKAQNRYEDDIAVEAAIPVVHEALLKVTKAASDNTPATGSQVTFDIAVTNEGPSQAWDVVVQDALPLGLTYVMDTRGCGVEALAAGQCGIGNVGPGETAHMQVVTTVDIDAACGVDLVNQATAQENLFQNINNTGGTAAVTPRCVADLRLQKMGKPDGTVRAGDTITYTLIVDNLGAGYAYDVNIIDLFFGSMAFDWAIVDSNLEMTCEEEDGSVTAAPFIADEVECSLDEPLPPLPSEESRWILTLAARATEDGSLNNMATVHAAGSVDPDLSNNVASSAHQISATADLVVAKQLLDAETLVAGVDASYQVDVTNLGPSIAEGVMLKDYLPAGMELTGYSGTGDPGEHFSCYGGVPGAVDAPLACSFGNLEPGETQTIIVGVRVNADVPGGIYLANSVTVDSSAFDPNMQNNYAQSSALVENSADLQIEKASVLDAVLAGNVVAYDLTVRNMGPSIARDVRFSDLLPFEGEVLSARVLYGDADTTCEIMGSITPGMICQDEDMDPGEYMVVRLQAQVSELQLDGTVTNVATVVSDTPDPDLTNNEASAETLIVLASADVQIWKFGEPDEVLAGEPVEYWIEVYNAGPSPAYDVYVQDFLPFAGEVLSVAVSEGSGSCQVVGPVTPGVNCQFGTLPVGHWLTVHLAARVSVAQPSGEVNNEAYVYWNQPFGVEAEASAVAETDIVGAEAELYVEKVAFSPGVNAGDTIAFAIEVFNGGNSEAADVHVTDQLPFAGEVLSAVVVENVGIKAADIGQLQVQAATATSAGDCELVGPILIGVECDLGSIPVGYGKVVILQARVSETQEGGQYTNSAYVGWTTPQGDRDATDADAPFSIVAADSDLTIRKSGAPQTVTSGNNVRYTITVQNTGNADATNVEIRDQLPFRGEVLNATVVSGPGTCELTGPAVQSIVCKATALAPDQVMQVLLEANVLRAQLSGVVTNVALVTWTTPQGERGAEEVEAQTTINRAIAELELSKTGSPVQLPAGDIVTYNLVLHNTGNTAARDVEVVDMMPFAGEVINATFVRGTGTCAIMGAAAPGISCRIAQVDATRYNEIQVQARIDEQQPAGVVDNVLRVNWLNAGGARVFGTATATTGLETARAEMSMTKSGTPADVLAGDPVQYELVIKNAGPSAARDVEIRDILPFKGEVLNVAMLLGNGACNDLGPVQPGIDCQLAQVPAGGIVKIIFAARIAEEQPAGQVTNEAVLNWTNPQGTRAQLKASAVTHINQTAAVVKVQKSGKPSTVLAGEPVQYTISVVNNGPSPAHNLVLNDLLPFAGAVNSVAVTEGSAECQVLGPVQPGINCQRAELAPGETIKVVLAATVEATVAEGEYTNRATVKWDEGATNGATMTLIRNYADLALAKTIVSTSDDREGVYALTYGDRMTYRLMVTNHGPSVARGVVVDDTLPKAVRYMLDTLSCGAALANCKLGDLAVGESRSFDIVVKGVNSDYCGKNFRNVATVASDIPDASADNNRASVAATLLCPTGMNLDGQYSPTPALVLKPVTFSFLVTNEGPSPMLNAQMNLLVQGAGPFTLLSASADGFGNRPDAICQLQEGNTPMAILCTPGTKIEPMSHESVAPDNPIPGEMESPPDLSVFNSASVQYMPLLLDSGHGRWLVHITILPRAVGEYSVHAAVTSDNPQESGGTGDTTVVAQVK
ncbi:MAG: DUF11 domain-containing protein [Anaerolineales bacterium]|nr:DUF11 domain-containing protein [Anaerolineales bacterium]